jgi:hypothetical protein
MSLITIQCLEDRALLFRLDSGNHSAVRRRIPRAGGEVDQRLGSGHEDLLTRTDTPPQVLDNQREGIAAKLWAHGALGNARAELRRLGQVVDHPARERGACTQKQ